MATHALVLTDRGAEHIHRWAPSCSCGRWAGVFRRRKCDAVKQHRQHVAGIQATARAIRRGTLIVPRKPTPVHLLPEGLR